MELHQAKHVLKRRRFMNNVLAWKCLRTVAQCCPKSATAKLLVMPACWWCFPETVILSFVHAGSCGDELGKCLLPASSNMPVCLAYQRVEFRNHSIHDVGFACAALFFAVSPVVFDRLAKVIVIMISRRCHRRRRRSSSRRRRSSSSSRQQ